MKSKKIAFSIIFMSFVLVFTSCNSKKEEKEVEVEKETKVEVTKEIAEDKVTVLSPYSDIRYFEYSDDIKEKYTEYEYREEDIFTYRFNEETILEGSEDIQKEVMEKGKNPGLGIRSLHEKGITGEGVTVAIIDQNLFPNHPEYSGKIIEYFDSGCGEANNRGSMHGPAVLSLLVGDSMGVAPNSKVYYAAAPSWEADSKYYADSLYWIIEENSKLPIDEKIRVVSVSAAPSGEGSPFEKNLEMWDEAVLAAQEERLLVLDCTNNKSTGFLYPAFFDYENRDDITLSKGGYPASLHRVRDDGIGVPTDFRTVAQEVQEGKPTYQYWGQGGRSWGIPYGAGVCALGWQINPNLTSDEIVDLLFETRYEGEGGSNMINPDAFVEAVEQTLE
ncbi:MAG: S8/S53 family peptidase [Tissierellia bacterium]|nr:S8/S53 family peptidase [Tissierellia bacterium]